MNIDLTRLSAAERLLWGYGVTAPSHIDLDGIAQDKNAKVVYRQLDGCEARLVACGDQAIISINRGSPEGRQRFSLAHELAHWICDRHTGSFLCAQADIGPQNAEARSTEAQANGYASQLILPSYLVDPWCKDKVVSLEAADVLAHDFRTSLTAAAIKLVKRSPQAAVIACHDKTRLMWHQRSLSFPHDFYVVNELHQETEALTIAFTGRSGMTKLKKEAANRWIKGPNTYRLDVHTQSIRLPDETVLTSISLVGDGGKSRNR
jgi:Zn-dependent peptidase ImmA (M78 family)